MQNELFGEAGGLQCLTCDIFPESIGDGQKTFSEQLPDPGLLWYWRSERDDPPVPGQPETPLVRPLALLTPANAAEMQLDLEEDCGTEQWRSIEMFACSRPLMPLLAPSLKAAKANFRKLEPGPLECVIHVESDQRLYQYVFFPPKVHPGLQKLWKEWGVDPANAVRCERRGPVFLLDDYAFFPIFLRPAGEVEIIKFYDVRELERWAKSRRPVIEKYEGWDRQAIPVKLVYQNGGLGVEREGELPDFPAALQAFSAYAEAHGGAFDPGRRFHDLGAAFTVLTSEVTALRPQSWIKKLLTRGN